jgi:hypothetical protein
MYNDMTKKQFDKEVADLSSKARARVSLYIANAMHSFCNTPCYEIHNHLHWALNQALIR